MKKYQEAFGVNYDLGICIPESFIDESYKNDTGPCFVYQVGTGILKIWILPELPSERDIEGGLRYTLIKMKAEPGDDYQEFVDVLFECESPAEFEKVISNHEQLIKWLS
ncbi:hypothetical protein [uncultured Endozoicomonas sp.]|uniref:hypothetical protein n=1 Tax=uncultured Endozoicomonas sp. TaxID=432652 RepID=UPI00262D602F|nr:hypothetical protein [uncultured Endozoicomonas sp.]